MQEKCYNYKSPSTKYMNPPLVMTITIVNVGTEKLSILTYLLLPLPLQIDTQNRDRKYPQI